MDRVSKHGSTELALVAIIIESQSQEINEITEINSSHGSLRRTQNLTSNDETQALSLPRAIRRLTMDKPEYKIGRNTFRNQSSLY
jgi:hypothetical protein